VEGHEKHVRLILEALREAGACANKKKSILFCRRDTPLGPNHLIPWCRTWSIQTRQDPRFSLSLISVIHQRIQRISQLHKSVHSPVVRTVYRPLRSHQEKCRIQLGTNPRGSLPKHQATRQEQTHLKTNRSRQPSLSNACC
jgi:hypothetical protein